MTVKNASSPPNWDDDDLPEWTEDQFARAQLSIGGKVVRHAQGTLTKPGRPKSTDPKKQVTLRLDSAVLEAFRAKGPGWQSRINAELRKALGI
ncbi:MAG TPA: BrnA antitoxin family protein [Novosphingobium sp.]|nr:BrnA antitoxin family protein [Novosphingobium sp.]HQA18125.1 BrnA antitoxin family protein [Novosphingobium sp.]